MDNNDLRGRFNEETGEPIAPQPQANGISPEGSFNVQTTPVQQSNFGPIPQPQPNMNIQNSQPSFQTINPLSQNQPLNSPPPMPAKPKGDWWWSVVSFFVPWLAFLGYFELKDKRPVTAESCKKFGIAGLIVNVALPIVLCIIYFVVIMITMFAGLASTM